MHGWTTVFVVAVFFVATLTRSAFGFGEALGIIVAAFAIGSLWKRDAEPRLIDERFAWPFGFAAGVLGGAYGMNGPPLAMYGALRRWTPERFRATLQGYFRPASAIVAIALGRIVNRRLDARRFVAFLYAGLVASGAALLLQAWL